jgi:putative endonuclease
MSQTYHVYIMASRSKRLYVGVTSDLHRRIYQHKTNTFEGFTGRYNITSLVHYEQTSDVKVAIARERQLKGWVRKRKVALIEESNPEWKDLSDGWYGASL